MNKKCYIAGPMTGIHLFNFPAFDEMSKRLTEAGYEPVNPADIDRAAGFDPVTLPPDWDYKTLPTGLDLRDFICRDVAAIPECQFYVMLDGWAHSTGAVAEKTLLDWCRAQRLDREHLQPCPSTGPMLTQRRKGETVLQEAARIVDGPRQDDYDHPSINHARTAAMFSAFLGVNVTPEQVCILNILQKCSRGAKRITRDTTVDIAGYARNIEMVKETP